MILQETVEKYGAALLERLQPFRVYLACTGAGAGLQDLLWGIPGCSKFFVGASLPYAKEATDDFLGFESKKYCSLETAVDLALESYRRAYSPTSSAEPVGLGLTASVASLTEHRGDHRVFVAVVSRRVCLAQELTLTKGHGFQKRQEDGNTVNTLGLNTLFAALGLKTDPWIFGGDVAFGARELAHQRVMAHPYFRADGKRFDKWDGEFRYIFPGSFNPPHEGHFGIAKEIQRRRGREPLFSLTVDPPHKNHVELHEILERSVLLKGHDFLVSEGDALFVEKARRHLDTTFLIGSDTVQRMLEPVWYKYDRLQKGCQDVKTLASKFRETRAHFLVFGRANAGGQFIELKDIPEADDLFDIFAPLPGRWDISSTAVRARAGVVST